MKRKIMLTALIFGTLLIAVFFSFFQRTPSHDQNDKLVVHSSFYTQQEAQYLKREIARQGAGEPLPVAQALGGVVPHHVPEAIPLLVRFYARLHASQKVDTFVIIGPDHFERGKGDVSVSYAQFYTPFGSLMPDVKVIDKLVTSGLAVRDETPFNDHSIHSQLLLINKFFPRAKIVPLVVRSRSTNAFAQQLGTYLGSVLGPRSFVVASVDFSHYLSRKQARPLDEQSANTLSLIDPYLAALVDADSPQSLAILIAAVKNRGADISIPLGTFNSADYSEGKDYTTGYVVQFFGKQTDGGKETSDQHLIFVGDIMLSRSVGDRMSKEKDFSFPFQKIRNFLLEADMAIGNLEGPISVGGKKAGSIYSFRADPRSVRGLRDAGFDMVSLANNHIWDYGRDAFLDTLQYLSNVGIGYAGAGDDYEEAHDGFTAKIGETTVTFLAYTDLISPLLAARPGLPGVSYLREDELVRDIERAKEKNRLVVVLFHWGEEYKTSHNVIQERIAQKAINAGASLVVGHHPHVVQEVEKYKDGWIAYSLGNFVFDQTFSKETTQGLALEVVINNNKIKKLIQHPVFISLDYQPTLLLK